MIVPETGPSVDGLSQTVDGYRGIWFTIGQSKSEYGDKYSGGLGTYTMKHIPMAVYSPEVDRTYFVYGGCPDTGKAGSNVWSVAMTTARGCSESLGW